MTRKASRQRTSAPSAAMSGERFSFDTIKNFDKHVSLSVPNYLLLQDTLVLIADYFLEDDKCVYDLGCSTGTLLKRLPFKGKKIGMDNSKNLLPSASDDIEFRLCAVIAVIAGLVRNLSDYKGLGSIRQVTMQKPGIASETGGKTPA